MDIPSLSYAWQSWGNYDDQLDSYSGCSYITSPVYNSQSKIGEEVVGEDDIRIVNRQS